MKTFGGSALLALGYLILGWLIGYIQGSGLDGFVRARAQAAVSGGSNPKPPEIQRNNTERKTNAPR